MQPAYAAFILRIALGIIMIAHAALKVFVFTVPGTVQFFGSIGLPAALAYLTIAAELAGGAALVAGVATRTAALALVPFLVGATWAHAGNGWVFTAANGGWEYPAFLTLALIVQALLGSGAYALGDLGRRPAAAPVGRATVVAS